MKIGNYWQRPETVQANAAIREARLTKNPTMLEQALAWRQSITDGLVAKWRAYRDLKTGRLEKIRAACAAGDESRARAILHDLMGLRGASDDTIRKGIRAFQKAYPTL
jgi:hypothetical protein